MALFSLSLQKILRNFLYNLLTVYVFLLMYKPKQSKALTFKNSLMVPGREILSPKNLKQDWEVD